MEQAKTERAPRFTLVISWFFLAYFVILFAERLQSLVQTAARAGLFNTAFHGCVNVISILSLSAAAALLAACNGDFWRSLVRPDAAPDYGQLTVAAGVLLVSGMVHTEFTAATVQFIAYGALIVAMVLRTVEVARGAWRYWYSLAYLTAFSMAIPVMYRSFIPAAGVFHAVEAVTALVLVFMFTMLMRLLFLGQGADLLLYPPLAVMAAGDALILAMRWQEKVNVFVLVFAALTVLLFIAGRVLFAVLDKKNGDEPPAA